MTDTTLPGVLLHGTAAARPAANAVAKGTVYSATDTGAITQSDGVSTWSTWATISAGGSGSITASGYTQNTAKMLGRTTGSSGAIEEISVGTGLSLSAGSLTATGGSGGWPMLEAHTASGVSTVLDFTSFISSTYDVYMFTINGLAPVTNTATVQVQFGTGGGPTWDTGSNYEWAWLGITSGGGSVNHNGSSGVSELFSSMSNNSAYGFGVATLYLHDPQNTTQRRSFIGTTQFANSTPAAVYAQGGIQYTATGTAISGVRFVSTSGNLNVGTIRVYGIPKT